MGDCSSNHQTCGFDFDASFHTHDGSSMKTRDEFGLFENLDLTNQ